MGLAHMSCPVFQCPLEVICGSLDGRCGCGFVSFPFLVTDHNIYGGFDGNRQHLAYLSASAVQDRRGKMEKQGWQGG